MFRKLAGRVMVITGASSGIGAGTAREAAKRGMRLTLAARRTERLEAVARDVRHNGGEAIVSPTDVSDAEQVRTMVARTVDRFGRLDVMFANAGYGFFRPVAEPLDEEERRMFAVNYEGTLHCVRAALPVMRRQRGGHLIVSSSIVGKVGLPYYGAYAATKAAQHALAASLRLEVEAEGIDVSTLYPVGTQSKFFETAARISGVDALGEHTPSFLLQTPHGVARRVVRCLRFPSPEIWPSRLSHLGVVVWAASPRFQRFCFRFQARRARKALRKASAGEPPRPLAK